MKFTKEMVGYIGRAQEGKVIIETLQKILARLMLSEPCKEYRVNRKIKVTISLEE